LAGAIIRGALSSDTTLQSATDLQTWVQHISELGHLSQTEKATIHTCTTQLGKAHSPRTGTLTNHHHSHIAAHDVETHNGHGDQEEVEESIVSLCYTVTNLEKSGDHVIVT